MLRVALDFNYHARFSRALIMSFNGWVQKLDGGLGRSLRIKCLGGVEEQLTGKLGLGAWEELQQLENAKVDSQLKKSETLCITRINC